MTREERNNINEIMEEKKNIKPATVSDLLEDVRTDICDNFCKYSVETEGITDLINEICVKKCPLNKL